MGEKSRPEGWMVDICISDCTNRTECKSCFRRSKYKSPRKEVNLNGKHQDTEHR